MIVVIRRLSRLKPNHTSLHLPHYHHHLLFTTESTNSLPLSPSPVNQDHLLRVCTILFQQQTSPDFKLHSKLSSFPFTLTHEFFLQVCNNFSISWRPVHRLFLYTQQQNPPPFSHTSTSFNKMLDVYGKARNIDIFWSTIHEMGRLGLVNEKTFLIALKTLAACRELKKCVEFFHLTNGFGVGYSVKRLNLVVECLCKEKLVEEAKFVAFKLKDCIRLDGFTYGLLVVGFCNVGDMVEASKIWNLMVDEGFRGDPRVFDEMIETFFKRNEYGEAMKVFDMVRATRIDDLGLSTYRIVIEWMCKRGKLAQAKVMFDEMRQRGIRPDNSTFASIIYGLLARGRVREAYEALERIEEPDIGVYHGLIKGLLRLRKASEATEVFREMIRKGCEPTMHTYVMLLQGHLGKRGRKGKDPAVNFDTIFVGGLVKAGKSLEATKYVERTMRGGLEVPRFDYSKFLHYYSNEEGVVMFKEAGKKLKEEGFVDLADIFERYGEKMATRDRRRNRAPET